MLDRPYYVVTVHTKPWAATWKVRVTFPLASDPKKARLQFHLVVTQIDLKPVHLSDDPSLVELLTWGQADTFLSDFDEGQIQEFLTDLFSQLYTGVLEVVVKHIK